jgi:hypothetical protein
LRIIIIISRDKVHNNITPKVNIKNKINLKPLVRLRVLHKAHSDRRYKRCHNKHKNQSNLPYLPEQIVWLKREQLVPLKLFNFVIVLDNLQLLNFFETPKNTYESQDVQHRLHFPHKVLFALGRHHRVSKLFPVRFIVFLLLFGVLCLRVVAAAGKGLLFHQINSYNSLLLYRYFHGIFLLNLNFLCGF